MDTISTIFYFTSAILIAFISGYGVVSFLLPKELREYRFVLMVPVGYGTVCLAMDIIAIVFSLTLLTAINNSWFVYHRLFFLACKGYR